MKKRELIITVLMVIAILFGVIQWKQNVATKAELSAINVKQGETEQKLFAVMHAHEECLKKQEAHLRLKLVHSYLQSLSSAQAKLEAKMTIDEEQRKILLKRISYIIENRELLELAKNDTADLLLFLSTVGSQLQKK
ncbi:hypothetical protein KAH37_10100 [bacterium]|nr:hypothetical protein [bacterium]